MPFYYHFPFFIIMVPMVSAILMPLLRKANIVRGLCIIVQAALVLFSLLLLMNLWGAEQESFTYTMGSFPAPFGNELRAGPLEAMMSLAFSGVMLFSLIGGSYDAAKDLKGDKQYLFYLMMSLLTTSLMALVYTNDIFTAYVFIEINTVAACAIVVSKETGETVRATIKYLLMSALGSGLFLMSTAILYGLTGHLLMESANGVMEALVADGRYNVPLLVTLALYTVAVAVKCALFPFHTWLPDAHGSATTSASAVLSGLVLKGYIILYIKLIYRVYGFEVVSKFGILKVLFALGLAGMIMGSIMAFLQKDLKRMIAYSSVAQIGYIFMGIGMGTPSGFAAASYQIMAHAFTKSMLFIAAGALINTAGTKYIPDMKGAARRNKPAGIAFVVGAASMIGVPFFAGFGSKLFLAEAAMSGQYGMWIALIVLALSTFLNALYYVPALISIYSNSAGAPQAALVKGDTANVGKTPLVTFSLFCLVAINIAMGISFNPLLNMIVKGFNWLG